MEGVALSSPGSMAIMAKMKTQLMCQSGCRFTLVLSSKLYLPAAALHAMCSVLSPVKGIWSRNLFIQQFLIVPSHWKINYYLFFLTAQVL